MKKKHVSYLCEIIGLLLISFGVLYIAFSIHWNIGVIIIGIEIGIIGSVLENKVKEAEEDKQ